MSYSFLFFAFSWQISRVPFKRGRKELKHKWNPKRLSLLFFPLSGWIIFTVPFIALDKITISLERTGRRCLQFGANTNRSSNILCKSFIVDFICKQKTLTNFCLNEAPRLRLIHEHSFFSYFLKISQCRAHRWTDFLKRFTNPALMYVFFFSGNIPMTKSEINLTFHIMSKFTGIYRIARVWN